MIWSVLSPLSSLWRLIPFVSNVNNIHSFQPHSSLSSFHRYQLLNVQIMRKIQIFNLFFRKSKLHRKYRCRRHYTVKNAWLTKSSLVVIWTKDDYPIETGSTASPVIVYYGNRHILSPTSVTNIDVTGETRLIGLKSGHTHVGETLGEMIWYSNLFQRFLLPSLTRNVLCHSLCVI